MPKAFDLGQDDFLGVVCNMPCSIVGGIEDNLLLCNQISGDRLDVELVSIPLLLTFAGSFNTWAKVHLAALERRIFPEMEDEIFSQS